MSNAKVNSSHSEHHDHGVSQLPIYGFFVYLMTDTAIFGTLFATFIVLSNNFIPPVFDLNNILLETIVLLTSSFTCGLALLALRCKKSSVAILWFIITWLLGALFLYIELNEFHWLVSNGFNPTTHAYFSAFFSLVGTHGLHVTFGLCWLVVLLMQLFKHGINDITIRKLTIFSLFWHFLDVVWIFVFSVVYLMGAV